MSRDGKPAPSDPCVAPDNQFLVGQQVLVME